MSASSAARQARAIADVELQDARGAPEALDFAGAVASAAVAAGQAVQHDIEAVGGEAQGDRAADTAA